MLKRQIFAALAICALSLTACDKKQSKSDPAPKAATGSDTAKGSAMEDSAKDAAAAQAPAEGTLDWGVDDKGLSKITAVIKTERGDIKFKFYADKAPVTSRRIAELIQKGFYNGLKFHRVVPDFVIQGGDPLGNGTGGSGQKLKAEFNDLPHVKGTVAMARAQDPDSADSQFYISLGRHAFLDGKYTVFGHVVEGMDNITKIQKDDAMNTVSIVQ